MKKLFLLMVVVFLGMSVFVGGATAASFPNKSIEIIVPWNAGGASDSTVRALAKGLETELKVPVMVTNLPGAGGLTGATKAVKARPDGYTLGWIGGRNAAPQIYQKNTEYETSDFAPVAQVSIGVPALVVKSSSKFENLADFVSYAKENNVKYAHSGRGNGPHLTGVALKNGHGLKMADIPYTGDSESLLALLRGDTEAAVMNLASAMPQAEAGEIRILALLSYERVKSAPDVPTFDETEYPIEKGVIVSNGICAPKETPDEIIGILENAIQKAMQKEEFVERTDSLGVVTMFMDSETYGQAMKNFAEIVAPIIKDAGLYQ